MFLDLCQKLTPSLTNISTISPLSVDRYGRPLRFSHLEIDKELIYDGCRSKNPDIDILPHKIQDVRTNVQTYPN